MTIAMDKVGKALRWTTFLLCLVFCIQGHPPARGQDGTTTATIGGITTAVALQNKDIAQLYVEQHLNEAAIAKQGDKLETMDRDLYTSIAEIKTFVAILMFLVAGNIGVYWYKEKKAVA
jgi:hypothetical protein